MTWQQKFIASVQEATSPKSRGWRGGSLGALRGEAAPGVCPRVLSCRLPSPGRISPSCKDTSHVGLKPTLMTSFYIDYLCKDPTYAQIRSHSDIPGVLTSTYEFGGDTSQPVTVGILRSGHLPPSRQPTSLAESMWIMACRKKERAHNCVNCHNTTSAINMPWEQRAKALIAHNWA